MCPSPVIRFGEHTHICRINACLLQSKDTEPVGKRSKPSIFRSDQPIMLRICMCSAGQYLILEYESGFVNGRSTARSTILERKSLKSATTTRSEPDNTGPAKSDFDIWVTTSAISQICRIPSSPRIIPFPPATSTVAGAPITWTHLPSIVPSKIVTHQLVTDARKQCIQQLPARPPRLSGPFPRHLKYAPGWQQQ